MANSIEFDISAFEKKLTASKAELLAGAISGMHDATDHLLAVSRDEAPLKSSTLRTTAGKEVTVDGDTVTGEVYYSATETDTNGERYNYALRVHEMGEYKSPTTPGTRPKFLSRPLKVNAKLYRRMLIAGMKRGGGGHDHHSGH
ncbi:hypothetical protein [Paenibacillus sabinae]|uniref:HK97 gp10 family phage protein n=1 Tax=Paenibacillus sabinae T27 TaxID=1268072 RepID=X4ZR90_9BACL|nr:hypothetical protein [Paenibacillus sabinae]AHV98985.1 hypothetical protein PSAB_20470 [Paenibacillus sabinae T27]